MVNEGNEGITGHLPGRGALCYAPAEPMSARAIRAHLLIGLAVFAALATGGTAQTPQRGGPPAPPAAPTRADILRGEYGRYRANNDLLYYHLDIRVDPEKKSISGKNTIRFRMLKDDNAHPARSARRARTSTRSCSATTPLKYERDSSAVFVDFPETLKAGRDVRHRLLLLRHARCRPAGSAAFTFRKDPAGRDLDQHRLRRRRRERLVAEQGSVARRSRDAWTSASRSPTTWSTSPTASSSARPTSATATRAGTGSCSYPINNYDVSLNIGNYEHFADKSRRPAARLLRPARRSGEGQEAVRAGQGHARGLSALLRRVSVSRRTATS